MPWTVDGDTAARKSLDESAASQALDQQPVRRSKEEIAYLESFHVRIPDDDDDELDDARSSSTVSLLCADARCGADDDADARCGADVVENHINRVLNAD